MTDLRVDTGIAVAAGDVVDAVAAAVAAFDLPDVDPPGLALAGLELAGVELDQTQWGALLGRVRQSRLEGPLAWSIASGAWPVEESRRQQAYALHQRAMSLCLLLERDLVGIAAAFADRGLPFRVLKGSALARLDEPDPSVRAFGDIDLLVRGADMDAVDALLSARGGTRRFAQPRAGFDHRFSKGASYTFAHNCEVDVHRTLAPGPFGLTIDLDELFAHTAPLTIGGHELLALDRPSRFVHACIHCVLGSATPRLSTLRDLVRTAPADVEALRVTLARADRWQVAPVVARAVALAQDTFGWRPAPELASWAAHRPPTAREARWLAAYTGEGRSYARQAIAAVEALPSLTDKVAYAAAIALPEPAPGRAPALERWRRGVRALRES